MDGVDDTRDGERAQGPRPSEPETGRTGWLGQRARFVLLVGVAVVGLVLMVMVVV
jgi:hypothetical protein